MIRVLAVAVGLVGFGAGSGSPPRSSYDKKTDTTEYSTGEMRTGGLTGMSASFQFPGKTAVRPGAVNMGFGELRTNEDGGNLPDTQLLQWPKVTTAEIDFLDQKLKLPATEGHRVSHNTLVELTYGHSLEEWVDVKVPTDQFIALASAPQVTVIVGKETRTLKGKTLTPLKRLAASIPPS